MAADTELADLPSVWRKAMGNNETEFVEGYNGAVSDCARHLEVVLARQSPSYEALNIIALSVAAALERAGVTECDDPGEAIDVMREGYERRLATIARQEPVSSGGFVISNGSGDKYMAWGQLGPEWVADRSDALWLVRRADAEALAAENEDAWLILLVERCARPPAGWACTLASGHEGACPTIAALPAAQAVDLEQFRECVIEARASYADMAGDVNDPTHEKVAACDRLLALIDQQAGKGGAT